MNLKVHRKKLQVETTEDFDREQASEASRQKSEHATRHLWPDRKDPGTPSDEEEIGETVADPEGALRHGYTPAA